MLRRRACLIVSVTIWTVALAYGQTPTATGLQIKGNSLTSPEAMRDLFDRWEQVWHEGRYDLVAGCVQPNYFRHDEAGDRTVTREAYAQTFKRKWMALPRTRQIYEQAIAAGKI
jgi:hypothetical protein